MAKSEAMKGNAVYTNATFQDGSSLMDYATRWGDDTDVVNGVFCSECSVVFPPHTWLEAKTFNLAIYAFCDCV